MSPEDRNNEDSNSIEDLSNDKAIQAVGGAGKFAANKAKNAVQNSMKKKKEKAKNKTKNGIKRKILLTVAPWIGGFLAILLLAGFVIVVLKGISSAISKGVKDLGSSFVSIAQNDYLENGINIQDEQINSLVSAIESQGVTLEQLNICGDIDYTKDMNNPENIKQRNKYLKQFLRAELCTQYPYMGIQEDENHYNGIIKIKRAAESSDGTSSSDMEYVKKDFFDAMVKAINSNNISSGDTVDVSTIIPIKTTIQSSRSNINIPAVVMAPPNLSSSMPLVIMCHGFASNKMGENEIFIKLGKLLASNGILAISIDFSGCGESTEVSTSYTLNNMKSDIQKALDYMTSTYSIDAGKIGIVGHGMGGRLASECLDNISAAALWAPANGDGMSGLEFLGNYEELYQASRTQGEVNIQKYNFNVSRSLFSQMLKSHPLEKISSYNKPILVAYDSEDINGSGDVISSNTVSAMRNAMPSQGIWLEYSDDHNFSDHYSELINETANMFCKEFLGHETENTTLENVSDLLKDYTINELRDKSKKVFTVDNYGNLYFVNWREVVEDGVSTYTVTTQSVNYKKTVEKFAMPIEATIALCLITQNPEYVYQFIEKYVLGGEIVITIQDSQRVEDYKSWYDWKINENTKVFRHGEDEDYDYNDPKSDKDTTIEKKNQHYKTIVTTTVESTAQITSVNTWMANETVSYTNTQGLVEYPLGQETVIENRNECPDGLPEDTEDEEVTITTNSWIDDNGIEQTQEHKHWKKTVKRYTLESCTFTQVDKATYNKWERNKIDVDTQAIEKKAKEIVSQWNEFYKIPNSNKKAAAGKEILINKELFLDMLNTESTQKQLEIYKYLIELYKNGNYSISNLDLSIYEDIELNINTISGDIVVDITKSATELVLSKAQLRKAINSCYSGKRRENLLSALDAFYDYVQMEKKVNAVFAIAIATAESSCGTNWAAINESSHNWMSVRGSNGWAQYSSFAEATKAYGDLIAKPNGYYFGAGKYTVSAISQVYCPDEPEHPHQAEDWAENVSGYMRKVFAAAGVDMDAVINQGNNSGESSGTDITVDGGSIVQIAKQIHDQIHGFSYKATTQSLPVRTKYIDCSTYVTWVLYEYGYKEFSTSISSASYRNREYVKSKGWQIIDARNAQAGDILVYQRRSDGSGHVEIFAGNGVGIYGAGSEGQINSEISFRGMSIDGIIGWWDRDGVDTLYAIRVPKP